MHFEFADDGLLKLYSEGGGRHYPSEVVDVFLKRIRHIEAATTEQDLRTPPSLRFEKLKTKQFEGKCSMRLNKTWRLILSVEQDQDGKYILIHEINRHYGD